MSSKYAKAKGRSQGYKFVQLHRPMQESEAWRSLSVKSRAVWLEIMLRYNGVNNGEIPLSVREAAKFCRIGNTAASQAFKELNDKGLIKVGVDSSFNYKARKSRRWIATHLPMEGSGPTNEWREWKNISL